MTKLANRIGPAAGAWAVAAMVLLLTAVRAAAADGTPQSPEPFWTYQDFVDGKLPPKYNGIRKGHPRLLITPENRPEIVEKIKAAPGVWEQTIHAAEREEGTRGPWHRMLASALIYQVGLVPGFKYAMTREQYGQQGVKFLLHLDYEVRGWALNHDYYAGPCAYDWLYDLLTDEQRKTVVAKMVETIRRHQLLCHALRISDSRTGLGNGDGRRAPGGRYDQHPAVSGGQVPGQPRSVVGVPPAPGESSRDACTTTGNRPTYLRARS